MTQAQTRSGHIAHADILLPDEAATAALAGRLADVVQAGDLVLLEGELGAGKTALARALIQSLQSRHGLVEDVPSPSFTLVQMYQAGALEIWHCDLYRLSDASELDELGLETAPEGALVLVEWPDRRGAPWPGDPVTLALEMQGDDARHLTVLAPRRSSSAKRLARAVSVP